MRKLTLAVLALVGLVSARDINKNFNVLAKCEGGKGGKCPENYHCNEFGYCIAGALKSGVLRCNSDRSCPRGLRCNEFRECISISVF